MVPDTVSLFAVDEKLDKLQQTSSDTNRNVGLMQQDTHDKELKDWLKPPDPTTNVDRARRLRNAGTGSWFLQSAAYHEWLSGHRQNIWLQALAGSGKTVLATTILDHLQAIPSLLVVSFYFDFSDRSKQIMNGMLRSLAFQLYRYREGGSAVVLSEAFRRHSHGEPTSEMLVDVISKMCDSHKRIVILLDALDESTERHDLLKWVGETIHRLGPDKTNSVQFLCTGRPEAEFIHEFPILFGGENCLPLGQDAVNTDICAYVNAELHASPKFTRKNLPRDVRGQILQRVGKEAQGM